MNDGSLVDAKSLNAIFHLLTFQIEYSHDFNQTNILK